MSTTRRELLVRAAAAALFATPPAGAAEAPPPAGPPPAGPPPAGPPAAPDRAAFDQVWQLVRDRFYDPRLRGVDWPAARDRFGPMAAAARSNADLAAAINAMLATPERLAHKILHARRAGLLPARRHLCRRARASRPGPDLPRRRGALSRRRPHHRDRRSGTHLRHRRHRRRPGAQGGPARRRRDSCPSTASRSGRSTRSGARSAARRRWRSAAPPAPRRSRSRSSPPTSSPATCSSSGLKQQRARVRGPGGAHVGYVHVWSYASRRYQGALEDLIAEGPLRDADALVWDLRDGWGGAQPWYLDLFNARAPTMQVADRDGETGIVGAKWRKPVAALINGGTRSGKEVLAYGFSEYGLGPLIGARTEGAVLAATAFLSARRACSCSRSRTCWSTASGSRASASSRRSPSPSTGASPHGADPQLDRAVEALTRR